MRLENPLYAQLREDAEAALAGSARPAPAQRSTDALLHELQVHQIELEMQNEALRRTQLELEEARDRYVDLFQHAPVGYLTLTRNAVIAEANLTAAELLGMDYDTLLDQPFATWVVATDMDRWHVQFAAALGAAKRCSMDLALRRGGGLFHARMDMLGLNSDPAAPLLRVTFSDISAHIKMEADLAAARVAADAASLAKSHFLARMSHELRTPMNAILGFSQILELENLSPDQHDGVQEIHKAGDHLLELINELLDLSRIEAGRLTMAIGPAGTMAVIAGAIKLTQSLVAQRGIHVVNACVTDITVLADSARLRQILVNLLSNATKYNRAGGSIRIDCQHRDDGMLRLSVADTGPGIAPELMARVFLPFDRLGAEHSAVEGAGIGLALSKKMAELMGCTLGFDSTLGQGSTFWLDLPCAQAPAPESIADARTAARTGQMRVLYVEDNPANLKVVEAMLRRQPDLLLLSAVSGEAGLELARHHHPDVILLDIHLPGMDGYAVLKALQADPATCDIPAIALSADAMPIDVERGLTAGFRDYLTKPVNLDALLQAVAGVLASAKHQPA